MLAITRLEREMLYLRKIKLTCSLLVLALVGISPSSIGASNYDTVVEAAKKDGTVVVYTSMTVDQMQRMLAAFKAKYPFI